jgi:hypothetical protein
MDGGHKAEVLHVATPFSLTLRRHLIMLEVESGSTPRNHLPTKEERRKLMEEVPMRSLWSAKKIQVFLLVMLLVFPAPTFGESGITIKIGPELQSQLTSDGLPTLRTYLPDAANPPQRCTHLKNDQSATSEVYFPGDNKLAIYSFIATPGSDAERILCAIANDPSNTLLVDQGDWRFLADDASNPNTITIIGGTDPLTFLALLIGSPTSNYTFIGPLAINDIPPCCPSVPAVNHWGLLLFALLLSVSAFWFGRRRRMT